MYFIIFIYIYIFCYVYDFGVNVTTQFSKVTDPNGISAKMIKNTISRQISDRSATRFLLQWYLLAMSAVSVLKNRFKTDWH